MIFIFITCIIGLIFCLLLIFLCYKNEKLHKILSFYLTTSNTAEATSDRMAKYTDVNIYIYLLTALCMTLPYLCHSKKMLWWYNYFCRQHTILHFSRLQGTQTGKSLEETWFFIFFKSLIPFSLYLKITKDQIILPLHWLWFFQKVKLQRTLKW